jgi:hypothetical protein
VDPPDLGRRRCNLQMAIEQSLVKTVARTKHELMETRPDWILVAIGRGVVD